MLLATAIGSLLFVYCVLDVEGFSIALSRRAWSVAIMPDGMVQLAVRKKRWVERLEPAVACLFGQVILTSLGFKSHAPQCTWRCWGVCSVHTLWCALANTVAAAARWCA